MKGISEKVYLEMAAPAGEDSLSDQQRIQEALAEAGFPAVLGLAAIRKLYPLCQEAGWKVTVSLAWDGHGWQGVDLEPGDTRDLHYGLAVDLGSTTVAVRLLHCGTGACLAEVSRYNGQITFGTDILTRIFACKDRPEVLEQIRRATVDTIREALEALQEESGVAASGCIQMVLAGNATMVHFLLGLDAFCVFSAPYAVHVDRPGFLPGKELGIPVKGYVFCFPGKSNYLGGDIISGMLAVGFHRREGLCAFFDIGTNGELVVGNREFLLCGAGAAGPALEGGSVKTGMQAVEGAVDRICWEDGGLKVHVLGEQKARGICGSGIVDLLAVLFLHGWMNLKGRLEPEKSPRILRREGSWAVEYAPGLFFYQEDIEEFVKTKAAAYTMVEYVLRESGIALEDLETFYVAGAFGKHVDKESAIAIGLYPDLPRDRLVSAGNTSLEGACKLLLDRTLLEELDGILDRMIYIQFGAVEDFLHMMVAAQAIPHTDLERFPSVKRKLQKIREEEASRAAANQALGFK